MGLVEDVLKAMDRIPLWKRLGEVPAEVDDLKARIADLEAKLNGKWPADVCRYCGERAARLNAPLVSNDTRVWGENDLIKETWHCSNCDRYDERMHKVAVKRA